MDLLCPLGRACLPTQGPGRWRGVASGCCSIEPASSRRSAKKWFLRAKCIAAKAPWMSREWASQDPTACFRSAAVPFCRRPVQRWATAVAPGTAPDPRSGCRFHDSRAVARSRPNPVGYFTGASHRCAEWCDARSGSGGARAVLSLPRHNHHQSVPVSSLRWELTLGSPSLADFSARGSRLADSLPPMQRPQPRIHRPVPRQLERAPPRRLADLPLPGMRTSKKAAHSPPRSRRRESLT